MIERILFILSGLGIGLSATAFCALLGLQSRNWFTFATINVSVGIAAAFTSRAAIQQLRQSSQQEPIQPWELERAIGAVCDRYAAEGDRMQILTALNELRDEVYAKR